jgi:hypothetical protein
MDDATLLRHLLNNPALRKGVEKMVSIAIDIDDKIDRADTAEDLVIESGREFQRDTLQAWANNKAPRAATRFETNHPTAP